MPQWHRDLTHWGLGNMTMVLQRVFWNDHCILLGIPLKTVPLGLVATEYNKSAVFHPRLIKQGFYYYTATNHRIHMVTVSRKRTYHIQTTLPRVTTSFWRTMKHKGCHRDNIGHRHSRHWRHCRFDRLNLRTKKPSHWQPFRCRVWCQKWRYYFVMRPLGAVRSVTAGIPRW